MERDERTLLATGSYQRTNGLSTWWWDGEVRVTQAGVVDIDSPSLVCRHPSLPLLYAVSELDEGLLTTVMVGDDGALTVLGSMSTGGAQPCWVTTDPAGLSLLIANYDASGAAASFGVIGLSEDGIPVGDAVVMAHAGSGPVPNRQAAAHVHQAVPTADGNVLVSDLGTDELVAYAVAPIRGAAHGTVSVDEVERVAMPSGSGPRHMAFGASGATGFVTGELDGTMTVIRRQRVADGAPGLWYAAEQVACSREGTARTGEGSVDQGFVAPSHVALAALDRFVLVANRGPSTLAVLDVAADLEIVCEVPVAAGPRDFTVHGDTVLVACQEAGVIEVHLLDEKSGQVEALGAWSHGGQQLSLPGASCTAVAER